MALHATFCKHCGVPMGMTHVPLGDCGKNDAQHGRAPDSKVTHEKKKDDDKKDDDKK